MEASESVSSSKINSSSQPIYHATVEIFGKTLVPIQFTYSRCASSSFTSSACSEPPRHSLSVITRSGIAVARSKLLLFQERIVVIATR